MSVATTENKIRSREDLYRKIMAMPPGPKREQASRLALKMYGPPPKPPEEVKPVEDKYLAYQYNPEGYMQTYLGWTPWSGLDEHHPGQQEVLDACVLAIRQQIEKLAFDKGELPATELQYWTPGQVIQNWIRVESGNGIGKTKLLSGTAQWGVDCFDSVVQTYNTTATQDRLTTWAEINQDRAGKGLPGRLLETEIKISGNRFAISRTTSDAKGTGEERTKGKHKGVQIFLLDESDGIPEFVFKAIETMESGGISIVLMFANPRSRSSKFHRIKKYSYVRTLRISSLYHPNVVQGKEVISGAVMRSFVEKQMEKGVDVVPVDDKEKFTFDLPYDVVVAGKLLKAGTIFQPKPEFMWTVLGIAPPTALDKTVISVGVYEAAKARVPQGGDVTRARVGVDCARSGADNGTVYIHWQDVAWRSCELVQQDTNSYVESIRTECLKLADKGVTSLHIRVDAGYGSGVIDALRIDADLKEAFEDYQVLEVHFGGKAYNHKDYDNVSTEMYYEAAETLKGLSLIDPPDRLEIDLCEREYAFINRAGKTRKILEKKEEFTKRTKQSSPDDGDGLVLAIAPDHCFEQVSIRIIDAGGVTRPVVNQKPMVESLAKRLGLGTTAAASSERVVIIGWPKTGKTTLATKMGGGRSTDEVMDLGWSEASAEVSTWFDKPGPWIIEGVAVPRALRKWRSKHPGQPPPVDKVIRLVTPKIALDVGQTAMGKGLDTVYGEILSWLQDHVTIEEQ